MNVKLAADKSQMVSKLSWGALKTFSALVNV